MLKARIKLILCSGLPFIGLGQGQFNDKTAFYNIGHTYGNGTAGGGISFVDFDGDGTDDVSMASSAGQPMFFFRNTSSGLQRVHLLPDFKKEVKHLLWVDVDNDGDKDLYLTIADDYNRLFINDGQLNLTDMTEAWGFPTDTYTSFGACWGDFNRDGWLDLYYGSRRVEKDGLPNISNLYINNGKSFHNVTLSSGTTDGGKTPFCSSFIDYNNDRWPDIYTAHDRKRGNTLLKNNKDGTFSDVSEETGSGIKMDGMSVSYGDCNGDGYFDLYISNTEVGNVLLVSKDGQRFTNQAEQKGVAFRSIAWGTNFLDGDNDGDLDLYVSGMLVGASEINSTYYVNQFPLDFFIPGTKITSDTVSSFNNAIGDINNDGYPDIGVINVGPYPSFLFENTGGTNSYIKINLTGVLSNRDGIGSLITVYTKDKKQSRYTQCGIGFMGQNSDTEIIGIGQYNIVDSVTVLWPTGHVDRFYSLDANKKYHFTEGSSTNSEIYLDPEVNILIIENTLQNHPQRSSLRLYPNPTNGNTIQILNSGGSCVREIAMIDQYGQRNQGQYDITGDVITLNVQPFISGMYTLQLYACDGLIRNIPIIITK